MIFSKNVLFKEEGLELYMNSINNIFSDTNINNVINLSLKMIQILLSEKHFQVCIRVIDIFEKVLEKIKSLKERPVYDLNITDNILLKINEKLGDVNQKVRNRSVELYTHILQQKFCDYNNVLIELVKDENRLNISKVMKLSSSRVILGKLGIFINVFHDFDKAIADKRTDINTFPFLPIATFLSDNINHSKSEIRKIVRSLVIKLNKIFGYKKLEPLLKKVDEKELTKLMPDIPEVIELIPKNKEEKKNRTTRDRSGDRQKDPNRSLSNSVTTCVNCGKADKKLNGRDYYEKHINEECQMFTTCTCRENIEVKNLNNHLLNTCKLKDNYKLCKRCKEAISLTEYEKHEKDNKCNPAKNINSSNRCPLCHKDISPGDKGFVQHLLKDICSKQKRKDKITTISK